MGKGKKTCKTQKAKKDNWKNVQNTSSEAFLAPGVYFYGRARTFMAGRAFLWPGAHLYGRARIFIAGARICNARARIFSAKSVF